MVDVALFLYLLLMLGIRLNVEAVKNNLGIAINFIAGSVCSFCVLFGFNQSSFVYCKMLLPLIYLFLAKKTFVGWK